MGDTGLEHPSKSSGNEGGGDQSGAECGAIGAQKELIDPGLAAVAGAWPALPETIKIGILALVKASGCEDLR